MNNKYPIKYAVIPLYKSMDVGSGKKDNFKLVSYIISKCYLLEENIKYNEDGTNERIYNIMVPNYEEFNDSIDEKYDLSYPSSTIVKNIYDNYNDALNEKNILNNGLNIYDEIESNLDKINSDKVLKLRKDM